MENFAESLNLDFKYDGEEEFVLKDINLSFKQGEMTAVLGHNGCGKSTFAKHLNAILLPSGGTVYIDGIDTKDENRIYDIRQRVGMVFQNPDNQIVATIVEEDVAFALENLGVEPNEIRRRVDEALKAVGMYEYRMHAPHQLSGGQKQRISIARVFLKAPQVLLLDEATASLDNESEHLVSESLDKLAAGRTTLTIAHRLTTIHGADRILVLSGSRIVEEGNHQTLMKQRGIYYQLYTSAEGTAKGEGFYEEYFSNQD